ncbi:MAG: hypothetical protein E7231_13410 [Cellulosilyticum sp.]|nr:hypothetical protein [Cellulosilyticum sp.]
MGKVYTFPTKKKTNPYQEAAYSANTALLRELMETLILTYEDKIKELEGYKEEIKRLDGLSFKSPKEVSREVKKLNQRFLNYGITCNYFKFYTKQNQEILYYNDTNSIYVIKNNKVEEARKITVGEFIGEFEGYPFSLTIDAEILRIFDNQMSKLNTTIDTLKNTRI